MENNKKGKQEIEKKMKISYITCKGCRNKKIE